MPIDYSLMYLTIVVIRIKHNINIKTKIHIYNNASHSVVYLLRLQIKRVYSMYIYLYYDENCGIKIYLMSQQVILRDFIFITYLRPPPPPPNIDVLNYV